MEGALALGLPYSELALHYCTRARALINACMELRAMHDLALRSNDMIQRALLGARLRGLQEESGVDMEDWVTMPVAALQAWAKRGARAQRTVQLWRVDDSVALLSDTAALEKLKAELSKDGVRLMVSVSCSAAVCRFDKVLDCADTAVSQAVGVLPRCVRSFSQHVSTTCD